MYNSKCNRKTSEEYEYRILIDNLEQEERSQTNKIQLFQQLILLIILFSLFITNSHSRIYLIIFLIMKIIFGLKGF